MLEFRIRDSNYHKLPKFSSRIRKIHGIPVLVRDLWRGVSNREGNRYPLVSYRLYYSSHKPLYR